MSQQLGPQTSNRVEYEPTEVQTPILCADCPKLKLLLGSVDGLQQETGDKHLAEDDINVMALRSCARMNAILRKQDRQCRLSSFELPSATL